MSVGLLLFWCVSFGARAASQSMEIGRPKGIYVSQATLERTKTLEYLIKEAKSVGINTFVIDFNRMTPRYRQNIKLVKDSGILYVARIVVFPGGATKEQVLSEAYREKRFKTVEEAISVGADGIQLDYIRYRASQPASTQNAKDILGVIQWFKGRLDEINIPLQVDVFGITSFGESRHIGQSAKVFAADVDVLCPMVYPSHYEPWAEHSKKPYEIIAKSLKSLRAQFKTDLPFKLIPFIEAYNYHYRFSNEHLQGYILNQIQAVDDANADGWYVWSAHNHYGNLFNALKKQAPSRLSESPAPRPALPEQSAY